MPSLVSPRPVRVLLAVPAYGVSHYTAQLLRQLLRGSKLPGLAQPHHEIDPHVRAVEISAGIEQMRLE